MLQGSERFIILQFDLVCTAYGVQIEAELPRKSVFVNDRYKVRTFSKIS